MITRNPSPRYKQRSPRPMQQSTRGSKLKAVKGNGVSRTGALLGHPLADRLIVCHPIFSFLLSVEKQMKGKVVDCNCQRTHEFQDKRYGMFRRYATPIVPKHKDAPRWYRCTVCGEARQ